MAARVLVSGQNDEDAEDAEQVQNAYTLLDKHGVKTMAETFCKELGIDPLGAKSSSIVRFKGLNAAFPRDNVLAEVAHILQAHFGKFKGLDEKFATTLFSDWKAIPCPAIQLPSRNTPEFLNFRWSLWLANVRIARLGHTDLRPRSREERKELDKWMRTVGSMTEKQFKNAMRDVSGAIRDNLDTMLMHPDAHEALLLDSAQKEITSGYTATLFPTLPEWMQKRVRIQLRRGKTFTLDKLGRGTIYADCPDARRADRYRVWKQVTAANDAGESQPSETKEIIVP